MQYRFKVLLWTVILIIIAGIASWLVYHYGGWRKAAASSKIINKVTFVCASNDSINAAFRRGVVDLQLSDGRHFTLSQALSASGARYANDDKTLIFWNKGNTAFITEHDSTTYQHCVVKGQDDLVNLKTYKNDRIRFRYPRVLQKYRVSVSDTTGWSYASTQKGELIVQFKLDAPIQPKTNLSEATFTAGKSNAPKAVKSCMQAPQGAIIKSDRVQQGGITFQKTQYGDAGAGNFYQIRQFRTLYQNSCYSIEEMLHSTNIHNYPPERGISEFDSTRVWKALDVAWQTLAFEQ